MTWRSTDTSTPTAMGLIELSSIARGMETTDGALKAADVQLVMARTICSGKYILIVSGDVGDVEASVAVGLDIARECAIDSFVISDVHPDVFPALSSTNRLPRKGAIGIIEAFSVASLVEAIDQVAKTAEVEVVECRLAMALGGKAYIVFTGEVEAVRSSVQAGVEVVEKRGLLVNQVVLPNPRPELFETFL